MERSELIREIESFCADARWTEATFGTYARNDRGFVERLRRGDVTHRVSEQVTEFLREQRINLAKRRAEAERIEGFVREQHAKRRAKEAAK